MSLALTVAGITIPLVIMFAFAARPRARRTPPPPAGPRERAAARALDATGEEVDRTVFPEGWAR